MIRKDIRAVAIEDLRGLDAVAPSGRHFQRSTRRSAARRRPMRSTTRPPCASRAWRKRPACRGIVFSSSCSNYGAAGDDYLDESAGFNPVTPYAESKVWAERDVADWRTIRSARPFCEAPRPSESRRACAVIW